MLSVVNIKQYLPSVDYAMYHLEQAISECVATGTQVLVVVHGYGSHGQGGNIKRAARVLLKRLKKEGKIATYVGGEEWGDTNADKLVINKLCPETILSSQIGNLNPGVTVILIN